MIAIPALVFSLAIAAPAEGVQGPASQASAAVTTQINAYDALVRQRQALKYDANWEKQWRELRERERTLLSAAVNASATDEDLRTVFYAAVGQHSDIGLDVARLALKRRTATQWWHYTGIAAAGLAFSELVDQPRKTELLNEAKQAVREALTLKQDPWVWVLAGQIYDGLFEWKAAKAAFEQAAKNPAPADRAGILRGLWRSTSALEEMAEADRHWADYVKSGAATDKDYFDRGNHIASVQQRFSEAAGIFAMLATKPNQQTGTPTYGVWYSTTFAHWKAGETKAALMAAAECVRATPDTVEARMTAAMAMTIAAGIQVDAGAYEDALASVKFAISAYPTFSSAYTQLARIHFAHKRYAEAEREARRAVDLAPEGVDAEAHYMLGQALGSLKRWAEAGATFEEAAKIDKANPYPMLNAGIAYENAGRVPDAIRCYEEMLRRGPKIKEADQIRSVLARLKKL